MVHKPLFHNELLGYVGGKSNVMHSSRPQENSIVILLWPAGGVSFGRPIHPDVVSTTNSTQLASLAISGARVIVHNPERSSPRSKPSSPRARAVEHPYTQFGQVLVHKSEENLPDEVTLLEMVHRANGIHNFVHKGIR